jgi:hypothetical protein
LWSGQLHLGVEGAEKKGVRLELDTAAGKSMSFVATGLLSEPLPLRIVVSDGRAGIMCMKLLMVVVGVDGAEFLATKVVLSNSKKR